MDRIKHDFNNAAQQYEANAHIQCETAEQLLERLSYLNFKPKRILDLGSGTGFSLGLLKQQYPQAEIIGLDFSLAMCEQAVKNSSSVICADIHHLPIKSHSIDLIVSNFTLQWCEDLNHVFMQIKRIASPGAIFLFSTVGYGSLKELSESWAKVDSFSHVRSFYDMHDLGDALYQSGWQEPVMDIEPMMKFYPQVMDLLKEFKALGVTNKELGQSKGLMGKHKFSCFLKEYEKYRQEKGLPVSWEIVYGYAKSPQGVLFGG